MATDEKPAASGSEQVTATPPESASSSLTPASVPGPEQPIPLPPPPGAPPLDLGPLRERLRVLDQALLALLLVFTFLTASFPVTNSDFLMHLASGRLLAQGGYQFGVDPFTYTTEGVYWANHSWLFDLASWVVCRSLAGASGLSEGVSGGVVVLIVLKALALTGLAWLMIDCARQAGQRLWIPVACVLLAILAASPRFFLQPAVVSMVLLGLTMWLLEKRRLLLLPVVCLFWVNLDAWFLLGPFTVALYLAASLLPTPGKAPSADSFAPPALTPKSLGLVLAACLVACLVNPHHVRAFTLPRELGLDAAAATFRSDPQFRALYMVPWEKDYFQLGRGLNVAGLAYHPLVLAGLVSFGLTFGRWHWSRVLVWSAFLVLSLLNSRLVPFFAIVAGPITALQFLDFLREQGRDSLEQSAGRQWALTGRGLTIGLVLILIVLTIPNLYVQAGGHRARRVGWWHEIDPGLRDAALQIKQWQEEERITPGQNWFTTTPEAVSYLVWFCPGEKGFLDYRVDLFGRVAREHMEICRELTGEADPSQPALPTWPRVFARYQIGLLLVHFPDPQRLMPVIQRLHSDPDAWASCYVGGHSSILTWLGPWETERTALADVLGLPADTWDYLDRSRDERRHLRLNTRMLAFGPDCVPAPPTRPGPPLAWYEVWWRIPPQESKDLGTAIQYYASSRAQRYRYLARSQLRWFGPSAGSLSGSLGGSLASGGPAPLLALAPAGSALSPPLLLHHQANSDNAPPAELYLGIRAARRALAQNPDRLRVQLILVEFWQTLELQTRERGCGNVLPFLDPIRHTQIAGALEGLLEQDLPDPMAQLIHLQLFRDVYREPNYLETQVRHLKEYLRLCRLLETVPTARPGDPINKVLENLEKETQQAVGEVNNRLNTFENQSANRPTLVKARMAWRLGLCETSLKLLQAARKEDLREHPQQPEAPGAFMQIDLMLRLGRLKEAREKALSEDDPELYRTVFGLHPLGVPAWDWFHVQLAAASGDYEEADRYLQEIIGIVQKGSEAVLSPAELGMVSAEAAASPENLLEMRTLTLEDAVFREAVRALSVVVLRKAVVSHQEADLSAIRAWLALEAGNIQRAEEELAHFRRVTALGLIVRSRPLADLVQARLASAKKPE